MTAAFLQSELTTLISDSKRKNNEVKTAAEKSLTELRGISVTSETQLAGDLIRKPHFIEPFLSACKSQNVKLASSGAACLQRLVASTAIPRSRLPHLLEAFEDAVPLGLEVQLKVLQTLPSLLQLYADDIHGETLSRTLSVSADLSNSKSPIVSNTAGATFQQLVSTVFEAATKSKRDGRQNSDEHSSASRTVTDAIAVFMDLCALLTDSGTKFVRLNHLPPASILGTLESLLAAYGRFILSDTDVREISHDLLVPGLCGLMENSTNFGIVARALRITFVLTSQYLDLLDVSLGVALQNILKLADRAGSHKWKRVLALEFFRGLCSDFDSLSKVFSMYDLKDDQPSVVSGLMASLVRTASEDPSLIGLGRQSTIPASRITDGSGDAASAIDIPGSGLTIGNVSQASSVSAGISNEWSTVTVPCLDQFDKPTSPEIPETYVYTLILGCTSAFADGLSKFLMPLSVPSRRATKTEDLETEETNGEGVVRRSSTRSSSVPQKQQQLVNPLSRKHLSNYAEIEICAKMIEACWPAILASCSTFLNAALDSYFYHILVRTVQKLTQVAGVMELLIPRDALLTTLAKVSVPPNVLALLNTLYGTKSALVSLGETRPEEDAENVKSPVASTPRHSVDMSTQTLNVRNLLCLRALLNLGIALGPTLSRAAWTIVIQPMAQVDALMSVTPTSRTFSGGNVSADNVDGSTTGTLASEISAVEIARRRLFDSTKTYTTPAFQHVCQALLKTIEDVIPTGGINSDQNFTGPQRPKVNTHTSTRSISSGWTKTITFEVEVYFVLKTLGRLASINLDRFRTQNDAKSSWDLIVSPLLYLQGNTSLQPQLRLMCTNIIDGIIVESCRQQVADMATSSESTLHSHGLPALGRQVQTVTKTADALYTPTDLEIMQLVLSALENVVGSRGENLESGWANVFHILTTVVQMSSSVKDNVASVTDIQVKLYPAAFKVAQLVCSDFLSTLDEKSLRALLNLFQAFGRQQFDLNMSLTTIVLFWNINTLINDNGEYQKFVSNNPETGAWNTEANLWQHAVGGLCSFCNDDRDDVRTAALRMLSKIVEASTPYMVSRTLNSCIRFLLLPLLSSYQKDGSAGIEPTRIASFINVLDDVTSIIQKHTDLLMQDDSFASTWLETLEVLDTVLACKDVQITAAIFNATAGMILSFNQSKNSASFNNNESLLRASWIFWKVDSVRSLTLDEPNQVTVAAQTRFLSQVLMDNLGTVIKNDDISDCVMHFLSKSIMQMRHDQYTIDVSKLSEAQGLLVQVLDVLRKLLPEDDKRYTQFLLTLVRTIIDERFPKPANATAKGVRIPTCIAFVTALIEKLRGFLLAVPDAESFVRTIPVQNITDVSAILTATKYSEISVNPENPLWQAGTTLGCSVLTRFKSYMLDSADCLPPPSLLDSINNLTDAILSVPHLKALSPEQRPPAAKIVSDTTFDTSRLRELHTATLAIFTRHSASESALKTYASNIFHHSLPAYPRYDDLPVGLDKNPLGNVMNIRRGSIRRPDFPIRDEIHFEALDSLLSLVSQTNDGSHGSSIGDQDLILNLATIAAPYVLLRLVYPIKTFLADQPLRYLTPPPARLLADLDQTLTKCLALRVHDRALTSCVKEFGCDATATVLDDGRTHPRILYGFIIRFEELWRKLPRLKKGHAWQDRQEGQNIEEVLTEWRRAVSQGWGV